MLSYEFVLLAHHVALFELFEFVSTAVVHSDEFVLGLGVIILPNFSKAVFVHALT